MKTRKSMIRILSFCIPALLSVLTAGCRSGKSSVTLAGSTAFQPFAEKLAERYMLIHPEVGVTVQGGGSAVGIQSALSGAADIGMADLVRLPAEAAELQPVIVAKDGIVIVVHPSNPLSGLTLEQIRNLFSGKIRNWNEFGGPDASVTVVSREAGSGTRTSFEQIVGGISLTGDAIIQDSNGTIRRVPVAWASERKNQGASGRWRGLHDGGHSSGPIPAGAADFPADAWRADRSRGGLHRICPVARRAEGDRRKRPDPRCSIAGRPLPSAHDPDR
jgi:ABC-type phosphate transport system substrate-binding protein